MSSRSAGARPLPGTEPDQTRPPPRSRGRPRAQPRRPPPRAASTAAHQEPPPPPPFCARLSFAAFPPTARPVTTRAQPAPAATATASRVPSPQSARPPPRQYPGRRRGQRAQPPPPSILTSLQGVRTLLPPDEDVPLLVHHVDPHEAVLMRDALQAPTRNPAAATPEHHFA